MTQGELPKPRHCGQNWLDMKPVPGGRVCGQCSKVIVDFTKMKWSDIEQIQRQNDNSVCGMYSPKQLDHWGREVSKSNCSKTVATTALLTSLMVSAGSSAQTPATNDTVQRTIVQGTVTGLTKEGKVEPMMYSTVYIKNTRIGATVDVHGKYQIDLTGLLDTIAEPTIVFSAPGFQRAEVKLTKGSGELEVDALLEPFELSYFYIEKPTFWRRVGWTFKRWFGRKDK